MRLPDLTHLQFAVLKILRNDQLEGRAIRAELRKLGYAKSLAAFYQLMARMEDAGYLEGSYGQKLVDGQLLTVRKYVGTPRGATARAVATTFYAEGIGELSGDGADASAAGLGRLDHA